MEDDLFESVAFYDYDTCKDNNEMRFPVKLLVIDTDRYAVCFCEYTEKGNVQKKCEYRLPGINESVSDINKTLSNEIGQEVDVFNLIGKQLDYFNHSMKNYFRSEENDAMDVSFKEMAGIEIKCSDLEKAFRLSKEKINNMLSSLKDLWEQSGFKEDDTRIILAGKSADFFPIVYSVKLYFSFDPFLSDERFVNFEYHDNPSQIYEIGKELLEEVNRRKREVFVCICDKDGGMERHKLLLSDNKEVKYFGPIFVSQRESIELEVNDERKSIELPYINETMDCDTVEVGLHARDDDMMINIRRLNAPRQIYELPIG